jgi:hypothetical protein
VTYDEDLISLSTGNIKSVTFCYDVGVACDDSVAKMGGEGDSATDVKVSRLANKDGECTSTTPAVLYTLDIDSDSVLFDPDLSVESDAQFLIQVDWAPYADPFSPPHRRISLSGDGSDYEDVVACESLIQGVDPNPVDPDPADTIGHPDGVLWCLAGQRQNLLPDGSWQQVQWYHGGGDPRFI